MISANVAKNIKQANHTQVGLGSKPQLYICSTKNVYVYQYFFSKELVDFHKMILWESNMILASWDVSEFLTK